MAPIIISVSLAAVVVGHQCWRPKAANSLLYACKKSLIEEKKCCRYLCFAKAELAAQPHGAAGLLL